MELIEDHLASCTELLKGAAAGDQSEPKPRWRWADS